MPRIDTVKKLIQVQAFFTRNHDGKLTSGVWLALTVAVVLSACSSDPCKAAERHANTCASQFGDAGTVAIDREQCRLEAQKCTPAEQAELAGFYDCLASKNECSVNILTSTCTANLKPRTVACTIRGCSGSPTPCPFITDSDMTKCTAAGCSWATATRCSGTPTQTTCSATDQAACTAIDGCNWVN
ncbi:MAG: hypothetical protein Q8S33_01430 [Myxococcales bacterium]|nr:hypothetical protein [Myxococcales bacterium]